MMRLVPKNPWHLVWIAAVTAVLLTAVLNCIQSLVWYGYISRDLLIIGTIDAIAVALLVAPFAITLGLIERQKVEDTLRALTLTDELTKINNRRGFFLLAEQILKISSRTKIGVYLMYTDLDNFKQINDNFGHIAGDFALQEYARILIENYRESDVIARIGGDEFVLLPVGISSDTMPVIKKRHENILSAFNNSHEHPWVLSAKIGLAYYDPESPCSLDDLLSRADESLYGHKSNRTT